jgi:hypothetical protein
MRFTLQEWNAIYKAVQIQLDNVTNKIDALNNVLDGSEKTRQLLKEKFRLIDILEKLEKENI